MSRPTRLYTPGELLDLTTGMTERQWTLNGCPTPVEDGFIADTGSANNALILNNFAQDPIKVVVSIPNYNLSDEARDELYREKVLGSVILEKGTSTHMSLNPNFFIISFETQEEGCRGKRYTISGQGYRVREIANRRITLVDDVPTGNVKMLQMGPRENLDGHFLLENLSGQTIYVKVVSESTAYRKSDQEIQQEQMSRTPDRGGKVIDEVTVKAGGKEYFKPPVCKYNVRAIDPLAVPSQRFLQTSLNRNNYVELATAKATVGQVVAFFPDPSGDGALQAAVKDVGLVKFVCSDIVKIM